MPIRRTSALSPDPGSTFGIVMIKVVSEEVVQGIGYGPLGSPPEVLTRWNPLSRESGDLEPFAEALNAYLVGSVDAGVLPRIWTPYPAVVTLMDLLGHRYRRNARASAALQRMGAQCRVIVDEATFPGQQLLAVATDVLLDHAVTGLSPIEERHLGALLAWANPVDGVDPVSESERRALRPAAAMLYRPADNEVEARRREGKRQTAQGTHARARIHALIREAVMFEWERLGEAREAFLSLGLPQAAELPRLVGESLERVQYALGTYPARPSRPAALSRLLGEQSFAATLTADVMVRSDPAVREQERRAGRLVRGMVSAVDPDDLGLSGTTGRPSYVALRRR